MCDWQAFDMEDWVLKTSSRGSKPPSYLMIYLTDMNTGSCYSSLNAVKMAVKRKWKLLFKTKWMVHQMYLVHKEKKNWLYWNILLWRRQHMFDTQSHNRSQQIWSLVYILVQACEGRMAQSLRSERFWDSEAGFKLHLTAVWLSHLSKHPRKDQSYTI